jgi:hypothetical protein
VATHRANVRSLREKRNGRAGAEVSWWEAVVVYLSTNSQTDASGASARRLEWQPGVGRGVCQRLVTGEVSP